MKTILTSRVPTHYQLTSISSFGLPVSANKDGSYTVNEVFNTKKEAIEQLREIAHKLADNDIELKEMLSDIKKYGCIYYDAAKLSIQ